MANQEISEESVLYKTHTVIEKLPDGNCIKKITEFKDGKTKVTKEKVDCDQAMQGVRENDGKEDNSFQKENEVFDEKMRDKLREINKHFPEENKPKMKTKEETYSDGTNKVVKVTNESSSIEETKKSEKIPDGMKRILKVTRKSYLEETSRSVKPEEITNGREEESVKVLDESFTGSLSDTSPKEDEHINTKDDTKNNEHIRVEAEDTKQSDNEVSGSDHEGNEKVPEGMKEAVERLREGDMEIDKPKDNIFKKIVKTIFRILFYPMFKLNIL